MGVSGDAQQWWHEWQLRILVLGSLFIQFLLYFCATLRRLAIPSWVRFLTRVAYVGGDALAIYALATIFNRQKEQTTTDGASSALELIWAPVLLIHLGGRPNITAYSLEDHLLWKQHAIIVVSKVTVALYVFIKWWSGEMRLLNAAVFLFIFGIFKFAEKPWLLWRDSYDKVVASVAASPPSTEQEELSCEEYVRQATNCVQQEAMVAVGADAAPTVAIDLEATNCVQQEAMVAVGADAAPTVAIDLEATNCVQQEAMVAVGADAAPTVAIDLEATNCVQQEAMVAIGADAAPIVAIDLEATNCVQQATNPIDQAAENGEKHFHLKMFADLPAPYSHRLNELQSIMKLKVEDVYGMLHECHGDIFKILYTRKAFSRRRLLFIWRIRLSSFLLRLLSLYLPVLVSAVLFTKSHKDDYSQNDVKVTYILLWCTTALELVPAFGRFLDVTRWGSSNGMVAQYNLMCFCALKKKPTILMKLATFNCVRTFFYKHWYIGQKPAAVEITKLVHKHVKDGWKEYIRNTARYRVFNNCRGQWTLHRLVLNTVKRQGLGWSLKVPFDESVLFWHIATDLCFHYLPKSSPQDRQEDFTQRSREISNYMFYLLSICPEMLMPGTRPVLSTVASNDIELILKNSKAPLDDEEMLAREIIRMKPTTTSTEIGTLIPDACRLAEALMELADENERWQVIQGVWVEMLCYSAARCRGYLHAKSLADGGEYLSYVWLLWSFMGMETLADKMQRPEPPSEEEITAAEPPREEEIAAAEAPREEEIAAAGPPAL